jgi:hypothetical protein
MPLKNNNTNNNDKLIQNQEIDLLREFEIP